jgi:hypothetical protein
MSAIIRIPVHYDKTEFSPPYNKIRGICFFSLAFKYPAKKATTGMLLLAKSFDIC